MPLAVIRAYPSRVCGHPILRPGGSKGLIRGDLERHPQYDRGMLAAHRGVRISTGKSSSRLDIALGVMRRSKWRESAGDK